LCFSSNPCRFALRGSGFMYFTFTGNDAACAASLKVLEILEREQLIERCRVMGELLGVRLREALDGQSAVRDIRGRGLFYGIEIDVSRDAVVMAALERGLWVYPAGSGPVANAIMVAPPFVITEAEIDQLVGTLRESLDAVG
jgi:4-aminobutyrate aminotransferase-like enzyme